MTAARQTRDAFEVAVAHDIAAQPLLPEGASVGVAVSGGADSVALLRVLCALAPQWGWRLVVLHVNHGLRVAESQDEEGFVRELAAAWGLPVFVRRVEPGEAPDVGVEEWARALRRAFFAEVKEAAGLTRIATGHHRGDQAETVLFRLLRGAGSRGLGGMAPLTAEGWVRPLLHRARDEMRAYLQRLGQPWKEDSSNQDRTFRRNRLRGDWIPALAKAHNPALETVLANTATQMRDVWRYLRQEAAREVDGCFQPGPYGWEGCGRRFARLEVAIQREVILEVAGRVATGGLAIAEVEEAEGVCPALGFGGVETVRGLWLPGMQGGRYAAGGLVFERSGRWLRVTLQEAEALRAGRTDGLPLELSFPKQREALLVPSGDGLRRVVPGPGQVGEEPAGLAGDRDETVLIPRVGEWDSGYTGDWSVVDLRSLHSPLVLRLWHEGDQFQLRGSGRKRKIKELFQRKAIPVWRRADEVVLEAGGEIVWTSSFGVAQGVRFRAAQDFEAKLESGGIDAPR